MYLYIPPRVTKRVMPSDKNVELQYVILCVYMYMCIFVPVHEIVLYILDSEVLLSIYNSYGLFKRSLLV